MSNAYVFSSILLVIVSSYAEASQWSYTTIANTTDGRPCLADCIDQSCIVDWMGDRLSCDTKDEDFVAPKYRTAEFKDRNHKYCLSNCGFFGYEFEWCITDDKKSWDYCNSGEGRLSAYKKPCKEDCEKWDQSYYWCYIEGGSWDYCAPPRERQPGY